jgi:hypothetical protein
MVHYNGLALLVALAALTCSCLLSYFAGKYSRS